MKNLLIQYSLLIGTAMFLLLSCSKDPAWNTGGEATVRLHLKGVTDQSASAAGGRSQGQLASISRTSPIHVDQAQRVEVPFSDEYTLVATLTPIAQSEGGGVAATGSSGESRASTPVPQIGSLPTGTRYRVVAYGPDDFREAKDYVVGDLENNEPFEELTAGASYTFVAYSLGSNDLPVESETLALNDDSRFMYWSTDITLVEGNNNLDIVLAHQLSEITQLTFNVGTGVSGNITAIGGVVVGPSSSAITFNIGDGVITSYGGTPSDKAVAFPSAPNASSVSSTGGPVFLAIAPGATNATLQVGSMTIGSISKTDLPPIPLTIAPGTRYTLNLTITSFTADAPAGIQIGSLIWAPGNLIYTGTYPNGVYGFAENQGVLGDRWAFNHLEPNDSYGWQGSDNPGDACQKILPENTWRTPTLDDFAAIARTLDNTQLGNPTTHGINATYTYGGSTTATGKYFGTTTQPSIGNQDNFLFLPYGLNNHYWGATTASTPPDQANSPGIHITQWLANAGYSFYAPNLYLIRCVRDAT